MLSSHRSTFARALVLAVAALFLAAAQADARPGRGGGFGSRGSRTWTAPAATPTAPRQAAPIDRSTAQPATPGVNRGAAAAPLQPARQGGFFGNRGGLLGGFLGAGLLGMLLGYGLFGGMGGLGSILGLLLQVGLIVILARLAFAWWQRRSQPAFAGAGAPVPPLRRDAPQPQRPPAGGGSGRPTAGRPGRDELGIGQRDLDSFERLLGEVQTAYGSQDVAALRRLATPEAAGFLVEELEQDARRGVVNHVADPKLLQGDLAESWREGGSEYATVAMRFGLRDWTVDGATGRVVEGDPERTTEATEIWTFVRPRGGQWLLSAIQGA